MSKFGANPGGREKASRGGASPETCSALPVSAANPLHSDCPAAPARAKLSPRGGGSLMTWYDRFARVYDPLIEGIYRPYREDLAAALEPGPGPADILLDLACGTGQNFAALSTRLPGAHLIGVDLSPGMLQRAQKRAARLPHRRVEDGPAIDLLQADVSCLSRADLVGAADPDEQIGWIVCALGLSTIPTWRETIQNAFELLRPGGQLVIFDVYAERRVFQTGWVEWLAEADLSRRCWEPLEAAPDFKHRWLLGSPRVHGGRPYLASARAPS